MNCPQIKAEISIIEISKLLDNCEEQCPKYYSCDTVAYLQDELKKLEDWQRKE